MNYRSVKDTFLKFWYWIMEEDAIDNAQLRLAVVLKQMYNLDNNQIPNIKTWCKYARFRRCQRDPFTAYVDFEVTIPSRGKTSPFLVSVELSKIGVDERWMVLRLESASIDVGMIMNWFSAEFDANGDLVGGLQGNGNFSELIPLALSPHKRKRKPKDEL